MLGGVVKFQPLGDAPGLRRWEGLVQGRCPVTARLAEGTSGATSNRVDRSG